MGLNNSKVVLRFIHYMNLTAAYLTKLLPRVTNFEPNRGQLTTPHRVYDTPTTETAPEQSRDEVINVLG